MSINVKPAILTATDLCVEYGEQTVLDRASLSVHAHDRIGLVGRNGAGKSTFLKIISGLLKPDSGSVAMQKDLIISFLPQEFTLDESKTVAENVRSGAASILNLISEYENADPGSDYKHELSDKIMHYNGWDLERKIEMLISSLHAPEKERIVAALSGGEKRRVALCRTLISEPDILILDEPTNHLDTGSIEWIENFLSDYRGACIFVTHDRYFLDRIANRIVEISDGQFYSHQGNYTDYLLNKTVRMQIKEVEERKKQNFLRRELEWVMTGPRARRTKSKSRLERYYEIAGAAKYEKELNVDLIIPPAEKAGSTILELTNISLRINDKVIMDDFTLNVTPKRKIGIVGNNGSGKTTFLKMLLNGMQPFKGKLTIGEKIVFNYVDQARLLLNDDDSVLKSISSGSDYINFGKERLPVWTYLRRFLFTDDRINTKVGKLSGGERSRLTLAKILMNGGNFLLLDEPTNDLDLPTLRVLEEAISGFEGNVFVVSHDRYFLNRVCDGIIAFEGGGKVYFSEGDYDYYLEKRNARSAGESKEVKEKKGDTRQRQQKKLTYKEQKEYDALEGEIISAEQDVSGLEEIFASPEFYEKYGSQIKEMNDKLESAKLKVLRLYERWEELENKLRDNT